MTDTTNPMTTNRFRDAEVRFKKDQRSLTAVIEVEGEGATIETDRGTATLRLSLHVSHNKERKEITASVSREVLQGMFVRHVIHVGGRDGVWNWLRLSTDPVARYSEKKLRECFDTALDLIDANLDHPAMISMQRPFGDLDH